MIEINFFEQKKKNIVPYLMIGLLFIGVVVVVSFLYLSSYRYSDQVQINQAKILEQEAIIAELEEVNLLADQVHQLQEDINQIEEQRNPTAYLYDQLHARLSAQDTIVVNSFTFDIEGLVTVELELEGAEQVGQLYRDYLELPYIMDVQLDSMQLVSESEQLYHVAFSITMSREQLSEVGRHAN
ncbi:hypothetical protein SAMN04488134_1197 [Amphibacillus marinus]|uniref:Tfp pilus assembly protein PilN n=2 Tax=Amphibacillus marinus TaxID=872970 RepID=A0A1H8TRE1_9BACI|nr:hypothetical protein SAMN04488134_1197 [Amphibacillus marinus]